MPNEQTIDQLNIEINTKAKQSSSGMDKLIASIEKLRNVTGSGTGVLSGISASLDKLISTMSDLKGKSGSVTSLASSIEKLNNVKTNNIVSNLNTVKNSLKSLGDMNPEVKELVNSLGALAKSGNGGVSGNALKLQADAAKAQAAIDKSALTSAKAQEGLQAIADKNQKIADSAKFAADAEQSLNSIIAREAAKVSTVPMSDGGPIRGPVKLTGTKTATEITTGSLGLSQAMNAAAGINEVSNSSSKSTGYVNKLKSAFNSAKESATSFGNSAQMAFRLQNFYGAYFIIRRVASTIGGFITNINGYIENMNLFSVAMGKSANSGEKLAQTLQNVLGIDAGEAMRYMGVFEQMNTSFGIANKQATLMSENLTQLGYDWASYYNISTSTSFEKIQSALAGQTKAVRQLGIDTSSARLQQELYDLGIKAKVKDLSEADKAELIYIAMMKQSTNAQGDMARTIQTPANALRVLQAQLAIAGRAIGSIFVPALEMILPPAIAVVEIIGEIASELAALVGFEMPKIDYSSMGTGLSGVADDANNAATGVGDIGKNAKESAKQMNDLIGGFDEMNILNSNDSSASDAKAGAGAGAGKSVLGGINLPQYDALSGGIQNSISKIKDQLEKYKPLIKEILKTVLEIGVAFLTWKLSNAFFNGLTALFPALKGVSGQLGQISAGLAIVAGLFTFAYTHSENFRRGLSTLGDGLKWLGSKLTDLANMAAKALNIPELNGEFWTSAAAIAVIAIGAVAIALGAPIFGGILVVGGAIVLAIQAIGYAASDSIEPVNLFGKGISDATEKKVKPFIKSMNDLDETIKSIKWSGKIVTDSDVASVKSQVKKVADAIINGLDSDKNEALKKLDPLKGMLNSKTYNDIIKANQSHYDTIKKGVSDGETQINQIIQKAKDQHRSLKQSEYDEIDKIEDKMKTTGVKYLSDSQTESNLILHRMKDNHTSLSAQEASEIVKNSVKARDATVGDATVGDANKQYNGIMTEAQRMFDVGAINKSQYDQISQAAGKSKDDTIKQATDQHNKIVEEAKKQSGDLSSQIDWSTGNIKSKWEVFWDGTSKKFSDGWNSIRTFFQKSIPDWWNNDVAPWFTQERWTKLFDVLKYGLSEDWNAAVSWWNSLGPVKWWNENVAPWFTFARWQGLGNDAVNGVKNSFNSAFSWFSPIKSWWNNNVAPWFTWSKWNNLGSDAVNGIMNALGNIHFPHINLPHFSIDYDTNSWDAGVWQKFGMGGSPRLSVDWYAKGGVFDQTSIIGVGEYAGAASNPEIVTPQSIMKETVEEANKEVLAAINSKSSDSDRDDQRKIEMMRIAFIAALKEAGGDVNIALNNIVDTDLVSKKVYKVQKNDSRRYTTQEA
ncbi:MAG TPA: hypothetical protein VHO94_04045 [Oscillospiraceae bacterium]|nr:hypothetical protein [Oscillospiraceae bacterium]